MKLKKLTKEQKQERDQKLRYNIEDEADNLRDDLKDVLYDLQYGSPGFLVKKKYRNCTLAEISKVMSILSRMIYNNYIPNTEKFDFTNILPTRFYNLLLAWEDRNKPAVPKFESVNAKSMMDLMWGQG